MSPLRKRHRLLVLGTESRYGREVISGIHAYCRRSGLWEYHLEADRPNVLERARFSIEQWKADGIITQSQTPEMEGLIHDSGLPAVNFSGNFHSLLPTVVADSYAIGRMA